MPGSPLISLLVLWLEDATTARFLLMLDDEWLFRYEQVLIHELNSLLLEAICVNVLYSCFEILKHTVDQVIPGLSPL